MEDGKATDISHLWSEGGDLPTRFAPDANGWVPHGPCVVYRPDGTRVLEMTFEHGIAHGPYRDYWTAGHVSLEGQYVNGLQDGEWRFYDRDTRKLREVLKFSAGREVLDWDEFSRGASSRECGG